MIVILLPGFAGNLRGRKAATKRSAPQQERSPITITITAPAETSSEKVFPHAAPYMRNQANEIYCAAVRLARAMQQARKIERDDDGLAELSMRLHQVGIDFGLGHGISAEKIVAAFDTIEQVARVTSPTTEDLQWEGHVRADEEFVTRALPLLFAFTQEGGGELGQWFQSPPPMPEALREALLAKLDASAGQWSPLPDDSAPTIVSTTGEVVRIQRGEADPYEIALSRIPSPMSLCRWATYLGEKTWITGRTIRTFIATVAGVKGWDLYENPAPQQPAA